jgi:4-hydroxybenzoate polyprenyltransferase
MINRPKVAMFTQFVSKPFRLYCYFFFNAAGILLAALVTMPVLIFHTLFAFGLWFYSHKLKKILFVGNITATLLSIASFFTICLYYQSITSFISLYVGFIFLVELTREIIKDMEAMKGDLVMGYETIPVAFGMRNSRLIILLIQLMTISIPFFLYSLKGVSYIMLYFLFSAILVFLSLLILITDAS